MEETMSDTEVNDLAEEPNVKVFGGIFRTNWTQPQRARLLERIVATLWRRGPMTTGRLASYLYLSEQKELFDEALAALVDWKIITVKKRPWGFAYVVEAIAEVTVLGQRLAIETICEMQKKGISLEG
jgi:hypothetical protein